MNLPENICMLPWISIETSPIGTARPCCMAHDEIRDEYGAKYDLNHTDLNTIYHSQYMQDLRRDFRNGEKPSTCNRCWEEEAAGRTSKRMHTRVRLKELYEQVDWNNDDPDQLWFVDLKLGNICNLKCRICGSWSSSKWAEEELAYMPNLKDKKSHIAYQWLRAGAWPRRSSSNFWDNLKELLPNIRYFEFTGGEPWMIKEHFNLLRYAAEQGHAEHIDIHYNTNATQWPEDAEELWSQFGRVDIAFSIDNVAERFEYERYGAEWGLANEIIDRVHALREKNPKFTTQLCFTINIQNVYYIDDLLAWAETKNFGNIYFNMMHSPDHMSIQQMTPAAQKLVIDKLQNTKWKPEYQQEIDNIVNFIQNGTGSDGSEFLEKMQRTDEHRKQNFLSTHPEIAQAMGYSYLNSKLKKIYDRFGDQICLYPFFNGFYQTNHVSNQASEPNSIRPCSVILDRDPGAWDIVDTIADTRNNKKWRDVRRAFVEGQGCHEVAACSACSFNERNGATSARQQNNDFYAEFLTADLYTELETIVANDYQVDRMFTMDYYPSNYCNYECIMCAGGASSKRHTFEIKFLNDNRKLILNPADSDFYQLLSTVEIINLTGGETVLQDQVDELMDYLIANDLASKLSITLLTNASSYPTQLIEKFKKFKNVFYTVSIDGTGPIIEYQRRGAKWATVAENAIKIRDTFGIIVNYVLTAVSVFGIVDFLTWARENDFAKICISPVFRELFLSVAAIPDELKTPLIEKITAAKNAETDKRLLTYYEQVLSVLTGTAHDPATLTDFVNRIRIEDKVSKRTLVEVVPEWAPYFK